VTARDLAGKVAIVTGSSSGIGKACAEHLSDAGASVVVNSSSSVEAGEKVAAALPDAIYVQGSIALEADAQSLVGAALERWGRVDILINNAGTTQLIPFTDLDAVTDEVWEAILGTNLLGTWRMSRAVVDAMRAAGAGVIRVNAVAPGLVETPWTAGWDRGKEMAAARTPLGRIADPDDIAATVMGLIRSPMTTGEVLMADGGLNLL
jgi:ketoreductase RED2